jgi:hypothetical protein
MEKPSEHRQVPARDYKLDYTYILLRALIDFATLIQISWFCVVIRRFDVRDIRLLKMIVLLETC